MRSISHNADADHRPMRTSGSCGGGEVHGDGPGSSVGVTSPPRLLGAIILALAVAGCAPLAPPTAMPATATPQSAHEAQVTPASDAQPAAQAVTVVPASVLEERYGIRVTLLAVTAAGGIVDFRFRVVDAEKARRWITYLKLSPDLVVEGAGVTLEGPAEVRVGEIVANRIYWLLFPNTRGVVTPGTPVSVRIGELQLEPIIAQ